MADTDTNPDTLRAELDELRARLHAKARRLVEVIETMDDPQTVPDAWRAVRLVRQADAMVVQLHADPGVVLSATGRGLQPARVATPRTAPDDDQDDGLTSQQRRDAENHRLMMRLVVGHARDCGFWPNGDVFDTDDDADAADDLRLMPSIDYHLPPIRHEYDRIRAFMITRSNASTHHQARAKGRWPDGSPFDPASHDPGFYSVTVNADLPDGRRAADEDRGPPCMPWWFVRKRPSGNASQTAPPDEN